MKNLCELINQNAEKQTELGIKEIVTQAQCKKAIRIIKNMEIKTEKDVIVFCAAMNLMNTYVKQPDSDTTYWFKAKMYRLFKALYKNNIPNVIIDMDISVTKKGKTTAYVIVQIREVQFSFHQIKLTDEAFELMLGTDIVQELEFDGKIKQMCASSIFNLALNS